MPGRPKVIHEPRELVTIRLPCKIMDTIRERAELAERPYTAEMLRVLQAGLKVIQAEERATAAALERGRLRKHA